MEVRNLVTLVLLCTALSAGAQQRFTDRIRERGRGDGAVTLHQDDDLAALVNNVALPRKPSGGSGSGTATPTTPAGGTGSVNADEPEVEVTEVHNNGRREFRNTIKMQGYRIQLYSGSNSRQSKQSAENMARQARRAYPELGVYTTFNSPRWICRMGDFRTMEEANEMLRQLKAAGEFKQAVIVRSVVQIDLK